MLSPSDAPRVRYEMRLATGSRRPVERAGLASRVRLHGGA